VAKARAYAIEHLSGIVRRSGETYAQHGCEVAAVLRELTDDASLLSVAILHDILVHPNGNALLRAAPLTTDERSLVRQLHRLRHLHIDARTKDLDRTIAAFTSDFRILLVRMAHRLSDVRNLVRFRGRLQTQIARETLHMYTAIAGRLGMHAWRYEMEDTCFRLLQPRIVRQLEAKFAASAVADGACLRHGQRFLIKKLLDAGIRCTMEGRRKNLYSTYRKMAIKKRRFEELTDRLALRIIVPTVRDCYVALGVVHAHFHLIPGKLKDYIGLPKENGYRSIHTVVYPFAGVTEQPMEIQIRTEAMHRECEYGVARHGEYKNFSYALDTPSSRVSLFRNLESLREEGRSPRRFEAALRTYFSDDRLALFDGHNNLYHLRAPVTALDFACHAYGERCRMLKGMRINGRERPMESELHDGDTVDVRFARTETVTADWLPACRHAASRRLLKRLLER
jgi:(p)ppGpp synthase/HD superfamily hydrolase